MRLRQGILEVFPTDADYELAAQDAAGHIAVLNETKPTEHLLLTRARTAIEQAADAVCEMFVVGHLKHYHRAEDFALLHLVEGLLDIAYADGLRNEAIKVEAAL